MSTYETLRHFADSYGLAAMAIVWLLFAAFACRPGARRHHERAATSIFDKDHDDGRE